MPPPPAPQGHKPRSPVPVLSTHFSMYLLDQALQMLTSICDKELGQPDLYLKLAFLFRQVCRRLLKTLLEDSSIVGSRKPNGIPNRNSTDHDMVRIMSLFLKPTSAVH